MTRRALLDAAEKLFGRNGIEQTSVTDVAEVAGRSIGSLYHHFGDKAALVDVVVGRIADDLEAEITIGIDPTTWAGRTIEEILTAYVTDALATERKRPGYKRIINEASLLDPEVRARYRRLRADLYAGLTAALLERRHQIGHPEPEIATRFVVDQLTAMLTNRLDPAMTPTELEGHTDDQFLAACLDSAATYLRLRRVANSDDRQQTEGATTG